MGISISPKVKGLFDSRNRVEAPIGLLILMISLWVTSSALSQDYQPIEPMESRYSKAIRAEYAKCREKQDVTTQFFCMCKLLEEQCSAPRRLEHGDWNTVEFWPSDNPNEREVQFILFAEIDFMEGFSPINKGLVMTCIAGISEINIFVGENVDPSTDPVLYVGDDFVKVSFDVENKMLAFDDPATISTAFERRADVSITYTDLEDVERVLNFETYGFENVSKGWEKLCQKPSS